MKNFRISLLGALCMLLLGAKTFAQSQLCGSDEMRKRAIAAHPEILAHEQAFNEAVKAGLGKINFRNADRTTDASGTDTFWYDIPIVVHVIHDYGAEWLTDDEIVHDLNQWNTVYAGANADTSYVIQPFKKWIGTPRIRLHLATKDRFGNQTKGITRHRSYLTYNGTDESKIDDWPSTSYVNIWFVNGLAPIGGFQPAAYAYFPDVAAYVPFWDGVICFYNYISTDKTINHECGHVFSLYHPWGNTNSAGAGTCADGGTDDVDDTPPTIGHLSCNLYDTQCATGYFQVYPSIITGYDSLVDYPDTTNVQNIMDYSYCDRMFTIGQTVRMHAALNDSTAGRANLWSPMNLALTGALDPRPDMPPVAEFAATDSIALTAGHYNYSLAAPPKYFIGTSDHPKARIRFLNESWNDTISYVTWQFSNGALINNVTTYADSVIKDTTSDDAPNFLPSSYIRYYNSTVLNGFSQPGWVSVTMTVGDTSGQAEGRPNNVTTTTFPNAVFVADATGTDPSSYYQEFNPGGDIAKWPTFNYYNNGFMWQLDTIHGFYDHYCMAYTGFDNRLNTGLNIVPFTGTPAGDYDDMFSIPFDLSSFGDSSACNLNYMYSGASRANDNINDQMLVQASIDGGGTWATLATLTQGTLENKGAVATSYAPSSQEDWSAMSIPIPASFRTNYTLFRFRYEPGAGPYDLEGFSVSVSTGNNFYLDRINVSSYPAAVSCLQSPGMNVSVVPNPTNSNAYVVVNPTGNNADVHIIVSDVTGKTVFTANRTMTGTQQVIEVPATAIHQPGMYIVETISGSASTKNKLIVY